MTARPPSPIPAVPVLSRADLRDGASAAFGGYRRGATSFIPGLTPATALGLGVGETLQLLRARLGPVVDHALDPSATDPAGPAGDLPAELRGPAGSEPDGRWLRTSHMVGINVRTVGAFWDIVPYSLTLPAGQGAIHLLPIWEPGVVGSIYGPISWTINGEFFSPALARALPHLSTVERQLRGVVNLLHAAGRTVGMEVLPHTDRFSEIALSQPRFFEWLERHDAAIVAHGVGLADAVEAHVLAFLRDLGPAIAGRTLPGSVRELFDELPEPERLELLFGLVGDPMERIRRRVDLIERLIAAGLEPVPATMAPPFRGLEVEDRATPIVDSRGLVWLDYRMTTPTPMSRVFGPLTRYRLYETHPGGDGWQLDFDRPVEAVWRYVCNRYLDVQRRYGFDFMRGDMAHVQPRAAGVVDRVDDHYDLLGAVKEHVRRNGSPHFAYHAESFLAARDVFGYGEELDHLEASGADTALGDLQSTVVGSADFLRRFRLYDDLARTRRCIPTFTVMTADKDDPRFDGFYAAGNEVRLFVALFLATLPSYMGLGYEIRDVHEAPAPNEHYTKLYVFHEKDGPKARRGPYVWGRNEALFAAVSRIRLLLDEIGPGLAGRTATWRIAPDATGERTTIAWTVAGANYRCLFVANLDPRRPATAFGIPAPAGGDSEAWRPLFSTAAVDTIAAPTWNGVHHVLGGLGPGEGRVYVDDAPDGAGAATDRPRRAAS